MADCYLLLNVEGFYRGVEHSDLISHLSAQVGVGNVHSDPFLRLSARVGVRIAHSNLISRLSAQVGVGNAHSDPFLRLSAQVGVKTAHSNPFYCLSAQVNPKIALPVVREGAIYDLKQKNEASASSEKPI